MKKLTKIGTATFGLALGVTSLCGHPLAVSNVLADTSVTTFTLPAFETEYSGYNMVELPFANDGTNTIAPKVYNQSGVEIADSDDTDSKFSFAPTRSVYKVVYTLNGVDKAFTINVNLVKPVLTIDEATIIPDYTVKGTAIAIPYPTVLDVEGEPLLNAVGQPYSEDELKNFTSIVVTGPNNIALTDADPEGTQGTLVEDAQGNYTLTPQALGEYTIKYTFKTGNTLTGELTKTIEVSNTFKTERDIEFKLNGKMPTAILGVEATLPKVTVNDKTNDLSNIDAIVSITAKYVKEDGTYSDPIDVNDYKFTPEVAGDYIITYQVEDYYGNNAQSANYVIRDVKDGKAPSNLTVVDAYSVTGDVTTEEFKNARVNVDYKIPSKIAKGTAVTFPAIYAEDNVTALSEMTFVRSVKVKYASSSSSTTLNANYNENATYTFENAGTYVVTYSATDAAGKTTSKTFEIVVTENYNDTVKPKITFGSTIAKYYKSGDKITFNKPTAIDYNDAEQTTIGDARVNVLTYWYKDGQADDKTLMIAKNGVYEFEVPNVANGTVITIYTEVADTFGNVNTNEQNFTVINDAAPASINMPILTGVFNQGENVAIPAIEVNDNGSVDTIKSVAIEVYNKYGNKVSVQNVNTTTSGNLILVDGAYFKAINSGDYSILCVVTDMGNNITVASQKISVVKTTVPVLKLDKESVNVSLGDTVDLNIFNVYDEGSVVEDAEVSISINGGVVAVDNTFTATSEGSYEAVFTYGALQETLYINVSDNTAPTLEFTDGTPNLSVPVAGVVSLPAFDAQDNSGNANLSVAVTYKSSKSGEEDKEIDVTVGLNGYSFNAEVEGTYEVIYKAVDNAGNEASRTFNIIVGDKTGPVIEFDNKELFLPTTKKVGDVLAFDLSDADVFDTVDTNVDYTDVVVKLVGPNGSPVPDNDNGEYSYSFNLSEVGTYKLTYTVTDDKNNTTTISQNIEVTTDTLAPTESNDVGMVLAIIASLAVLAGVIVFFFKPEKSSRRDDKKKINHNNDKE